MLLKELRNARLPTTFPLSTDNVRPWVRPPDLERGRSGARAMRHQSSTRYEYYLR